MQAAAFLFAQVPAAGLGKAADELARLQKSSGLAQAREVRDAASAILDNTSLADSAARKARPNAKAR